MPTPSHRYAAALILTAGLAHAAGAGAGPSRTPVPLDWKRDPKAASRAAAPSPPPAPALPPELTVAAAGDGPHAEASRGDVDESARRAGEEMAEEAVRVWGWREYWRAGFARGVTAALEDPRLGAWDRNEGLRAGRADLRARALGDQLANEAAGPRAERDAEARVAEQFMDLARSPSRDRGGGPLPRGTVPAFPGPFAVAPVLDQVFVSYPPVTAAGLSRDGRRAVDEWRVDPASLARSDRFTRAYDAQWKDPARAFSVWRERQRRGSPWTRWSSGERERFRVVFCESFEASLRAIDPRAMHGAWRDGFDDGWRYGATIQAEWAYRQGYANGFDLAVEETASIAFPYAYDRDYIVSYDRSFETWSRTAQPGLGTVHLQDGNDDGVFEPGERVLVDVEVENYGGGAGAFDVIASGHAVFAPATVTVRFAGRGRLADPVRLEVRVDGNVPPGTRAPIQIAIAGRSTDASLYVSRPLVLEGEPGIDADRIGGRVTLTFKVSNTSRRGAPAVIAVVPWTGRRGLQQDELGVIPAGGSSPATVTFTGIHPLDLIGGVASWQASVTRADTIDDVREIRIAPVATDLTNPDLLDFMIALANTPHVTASDVKDSRELMMDRLRADWERAVDASGNPYKRDYESGSAETVLGEMVRATRDGRQTFASPQVWDGMEAEVTSLADDLPGAHPLLRKWMKKLAKRLG